MRTFFGVVGIALAIAGATDLFGGGTVAAHGIYSTPPSPFVVDYSNRVWTFKDVQINGEGNVGHVEPGGQVVLNFQWDTSLSSASPSCPNCLLQVYYGIAGVFDECIASYNSNETPNLSRAIKKTFTAPTEPGTYFLSYTSTLNYNCSPINMGSWPGFGVLVVGQEPWEVSKVVNGTDQPIAINTPVLSGQSYVNDSSASGHAISIPGKGFISFAEKGSGTGCRSPRWEVRIDFQTTSGQQATWGYYYDSRGELETSLASDGTPTFVAPRGGQIVQGLGKPTCK